jgi:hypothetical protein
VVVYPTLRKLKIDFDPISRIFAGFLLVSISMVYASVLQHYIYISPAKSIHVWIQAPAYIFVAFSEAFIIITGLELAFTQAPKKYVPTIHLIVSRTKVKQSPFVYFCVVLAHYWYRSGDLYCAEPGVAGSVSGVDVCWPGYHWLCSWMRFLRMLSQVGKARRRYGYSGGCAGGDEWKWVSG